MSTPAEIIAHGLRIHPYGTDLGYPFTEYADRVAPDVLDALFEAGYTLVSQADLDKLLDDVWTGVARALAQHGLSSLTDIKEEPPDA